MLARVGFDSFRLRERHDPHDALAAFDDFSLRYQGSVDDPAPLFRKRAAARACNDARRARSRARRLLAASRRTIRRRRSPRASAPRTWCCSTSSRATGSASRSSRSTPGGCPRRPTTSSRACASDYGLEIDVYSPWPDSVDAYVEQHGIDGFYDGVEQRKACCAVRKVEPLRRALAGKRGWITGCAASRPTAARHRRAERDPATAVEVQPARRLVRRRRVDYLRANSVPTTRCTTAATRRSAASRARAP
jgi:hypothetical protein